MTAVAQPHLELEPLLAAARAESLAELARCVSASLAAVKRWARAGVPFYSADRAAADLGLHPIDIWGTAFEEAYT